MGLLVVGAVLLLAGVGAMLGGLLPVADALNLGARVAPVLGFVVAITVVAELAAKAGLFDRVADAAARLGRGRGWALWGLIVVIACVSTVFLSLDTTAVLLTPIVVVVARRSHLDPLPFAMTTVWLANTASLLLPVSNLTNLLAAGRIPGEYLGLSVAPAIVAALVPVALLAIVYRRRLGRPYTMTAPDRIADRPLFTVSAIVVAALLPTLVIGIPVWMPATAAALVLIVAFALRRPHVLSVSLLPWQLVVFVCGLFLVVTTAGDLGLTTVLARVAGTGDSGLALLRLAAVGTVAANAADNLPAYLALEPVTHSPVRLMTLLVATNAGPLITPWASLATLLWHARLAKLDVHISWPRFAALGAVAAVLSVGLAVLAVALTN